MRNPSDDAIPRLNRLRASVFFTNMIHLDSRKKQSLLDNVPIAPDHPTIDLRWKPFLR